MVGQGLTRLSYFAMAVIIRPPLANTAHGAPVANGNAVPNSDDDEVSVIKQYPEPNFRTAPTPDDVSRHKRLTIAELCQENAALRDRIRRLEEQIKDEISMWSLALSENKKETVDQVRRRISRLKGSLEYKGRDDYVDKER